MRKAGRKHCNGQGGATSFAVCIQLVALRPTVHPLSAALVDTWSQEESTGFSTADDSIVPLLQAYHLIQPKELAPLQDLIAQFLSS